MSKKKSSSSSKKINETIEASASASPAAPAAVFVNRSGQLCVSVFAKPGSKDTAIAGVDNEAVHVRVAAPPVDGEANKELLRFIAKLLSLRSSDVDLDRGNKNRNKTLILSNCSLSVDDLLARFRKEASDS